MSYDCSVFSSGHVEGGTHGNAVPIVKELMDRMETAFPLYTMSQKRCHQQNSQTGNILSSPCILSVVVLNVYSSLSSRPSGFLA